MASCPDLNNREVELFLDDFEKNIRRGTAALFIGSGLSVEAGYPSWEELLNPFIEELGLDIKKVHHTDLPTLAQYYVNKCGSRTKLVERIKSLYGNVLKPTLNYRLIACLPINVYWTTNYDTLLEESIRKLDSGRHAPNVIVKDEDLTTNVPSEKTVFKMHGCVIRDNIVITKEDYELYQSRNPIKFNALLYHLNAYTFLFIGYGLRDPNINYVLATIRTLHKQDEVPRTHYIIVRRPNSYDKNELTLYNLRIKDLKRYGLIAIEICNYEEISEILKRLLRRFLMSCSARLCISEGWLDDEGYDIGVELYFEVLLRNENIRDMIIRNLSVKVGDKYLSYERDDFEINHMTYTRMTWANPKLEHKVNPGGTIKLHIPIVSYNLYTWDENVNEYHERIPGICRLKDTSYDAFLEFYNHPSDHLELGSYPLSITFDVNNLHCKQKVKFTKTKEGKPEPIEIT